MHRILRNCILASALTFAALPAFAGMVVVTSASSSVKTLGKDDVTALYLGKTTNLPGGSAAKLYDLADSNPGREKFYQGATGKSASQVKSVWSRLVFSGRALPPKELSDDAAVIKAVAADPNAVGYVDSASVDASVHVVFKLP
ncbi:phosphate ABC transporter substrate-binding protein [Rhodanobacter sp. AS-Z3]|uniref:phosphate ABC transporter substrate-binding protein n=1 Tax=Rhodanobacter sp. AS-Z3 TaxID=3031330 RepID=UPI00247B1A74|nr:phosphate ABC transporter substrate-binding protein [Rhodanobacter sp. AS-Z3]WEN14771.1 phosphate ABC transporter substrate-binding protein [Rhodanobacter sp. AS-Z3]